MRFKLDNLPDFGQQYREGPSSYSTSALYSMPISFTTSKIFYTDSNIRPAPKIQYMGQVTCSRCRTGFFVTDRNLKKTKCPNCKKEIKLSGL
jgi:hypothetical protein